MAKNQRNATVSAIINQLQSKGIDYEFGKSEPVVQLLTSEDKSKIVERLCDEFLAGEVEMSTEGKLKYFGNRNELRKYTVGLLNNWIRKAPELNQGDSYVAKNPGSRQGSGDPQLKALRQVLKGTTDATIKARVEAAIESRIRELQPKVEIDFDALPDEIKKLLK